MARKRPVKRRRRTIASRQSYRPRRSPSLISGRLAGYALLLLVVAVGIIYVALFSPLLKVTSVNVQGTKNVSAAEVGEIAKDAALTRNGSVTVDSLLLADPAHVSAVVKDRFHTVSAVTVRKKWPHGLTIEVAERQASAVWKSGNQSYLIDAVGMAYDTTPPRTDLLSIEDLTNLSVTIGKPVAGAGLIRALTQISQQAQGGGLKIVTFRIPETTFEVQAVTDQGWYALFDTTRPVGSQVSGLVEAVKTAKPAQYADLRVPGRVYVR